MNRVGFTIASSPGSNREHERIPWYLPKPAPNDLPKRDQPVADHTGQFLSPRFFDRVGTSLLLSDPQPKNVIVVNSDAIVLVDIDYRIGNPALGLAQFICGLDSMRLRHPSALSARAVADWQVQFLAAYFERSRPFHADDLIFFYPWILLNALREHTLRRPLLWQLLARFYGLRLGRFLERLAATGTRESREHAVEWLLSDEGPFAFADEPRPLDAWPLPSFATR